MEMGDELCIFCSESLEQLEREGKLYHLLCHESHKFCRACLIQWWNDCSPKKVGKCPMCEKVAFAKIADIQAVRESIDRTTRGFRALYEDERRLTERLNERLRQREVMAENERGKMQLLGSVRFLVTYTFANFLFSIATMMILASHISWLVFAKGEVMDDKAWLFFILASIGGVSLNLVQIGVALLTWGWWTLNGIRLASRR